MVTKNFLKWKWLYQFTHLGRVYENSTCFALLSILGIFYLYTICSHLRTDNAHCSFKSPDKETEVSWSSDFSIIYFVKFFFFLSIAIAVLGFPRGSDGKESTCNVGDSDMIPGLERSPGEGNGNHSSIVTQRIPWTELPGELQSMESQRFGHNGVTNTFTFIAILLLICRFLPVGPVHL